MRAVKAINSYCVLRCHFSDIIFHIYVPFFLNCLFQKYSYPIAIQIVRYTYKPPYFCILSTLLAFYGIYSKIYPESPARSTSVITNIIFNNLVLSSEFLQINIFLYYFSKNHATIVTNVTKK